MVETLIKTLPFENGELRAVKDNRRVVLAKCNPVIELYSREITVPILGAGSRIKTYYAVIVICGNMDFTRNADADYLSTVTRFELAADIQRTDGVFEHMNFDRLDTCDIDLLGEWRFNVQCGDDVIRRLIRL